MKEMFLLTCGSIVMLSACLTAYYTSRNNVQLYSLFGIFIFGVAAIISSITYLYIALKNKSSRKDLPTLPKKEN